MDMGALGQVFEVEYAPLLGQREATFRRMFQWLECLQQDFYVIVETGQLTVVKRGASRKSVLHMTT
jgi:hypothetical protein